MSEPIEMSDEQKRNYDRVTRADLIKRGAIVPGDPDRLYEPHWLKAYINAQPCLTLES